MATLEKLEHNKAKLTITVGPEAFAEAIQKAYVKTAKRFNIPGFRKGKAPRKVIENMYGEGVFYEDAFEFIYPDAYLEAIKEHALDPIDSPDVDIQKISAAEGVLFTAEVQLMPEVTLGQYKGIEVAKRTYTVKDAEIDSLLDAEREKSARFVNVERPVENGDQVTLDYSGSVDGVKFAGGTAEDQQLTIGSGRFIPGFEEQLIGMAIGEERDINVKFPDEYHAEELKGKDAVFHVAIKAIQVKELPELDDELAQEVSEFDTLAEFRADLAKKLEERNAERAKAEMEDEAMRKVSENAKIDIPDVMIERQMDYMLRDIAYRLSMSGMGLEDYCKYTGTDPKAMREGYRAEAADRVRLQLTVEAITKAEKIEADEESLAKEIESFAKQSGGQDVEAFRKSLSDDDLNFFKDRITAEKAVRFIMDNAKLVDAPAEKKPKKAKKAEDAEEPAAEKPAKKPAAKKPAKKADDAEAPAEEKKPKKAAPKAKKEAE